MITFHLFGGTPLTIMTASVAFVQLEVGGTLIVLTDGRRFRVIESYRDVLDTIGGAKWERE